MKFRRYLAAICLFLLVWLGTPASSETAADDTPDESELARVYKRKAAELEATDLDKALDYYWKALGLLPESHNQKTFEASRIAELEQKLRRELKEKGYKDDSKSVKESIQRELAACKLAVEAGKKNVPSALGSVYLQLSAIEAIAGDSNSSLENARRGIELSTKVDSDRIYPLVSASAPFITALVGDGRPAAAESLLKMAQDKCRELYGDLSPQLAVQEVQLMTFFVGQKELNRADVILERILSIAPHTGGFDSRAQEIAITNLCNQTYVFMQTEPVYVWSVLSKILNSQRGFYGPDDIRVAEVLDVMVQHASIEQNYGNAENYLKQSLAIKRLYGENAGSERLFEIGRKLGREQSIEEFHASEFKWYQSSHLQELSNPSTLSTVQLCNCYAQLHSIAPYSAEASICVVELLKRYKASHDWNEIPPLACDGLKISEHRHYGIRASCLTRFVPSTDRAKYHKAIIEAFTAQHLPAKAMEQLQKAAAEFPPKPTVSDLICLAEESEETKDNALAVGMWVKALDAAKTNSEAIYYGPQIATAFARLGAKNENARALGRAKQARDNYDQDRVKKAMEQERIRPSIPAVINKFGPIRQVSKTYLFNFAALACNSLVLKDGAKISTDDFGIRHHAFAGCFGPISTSQPVCSAGAFSFVYIGMPRSLGPLSQLNTGLDNMNVKFKLGEEIFTEPPPIPERPFMDGPSPPTQAISLGAIRGEVNLKPGDYIADSIATTNIITQTPGRVRIFLRDKKSGDEPIMLVKDGARINSFVLSFRKETIDDNHFPYKFEIWYNGTRPIQFEGNTSFDGIIYAPKAKVKLGPGHVDFNGAMVAMDIVASGDTIIRYEKELAKWRDTDTQK